jgi:predicted enzyme related to lactoylglutathione lyase
LKQQGFNLSNSKAEINQQITWVYTHDLDLTAKFYSQVLGLHCVRETAEGRIFVTAPGAAIGLCRAFNDRVVEPKGGMISIVTNDVDRWYHQLLERGANIEAAPHRLPQFGIYTFFISDPNGYVIEFQQFDD